MQKLPLLLEGKKIDVEIFIPESYDTENAAGDSSEEKEEMRPSCTIEVRGMKESTSRDTVELYFESRHAAGESVDILQFDDSERQEEGVIYISFETDEG